MIQIELQPELEAQLAAEAQARGMELNEYIIEKLEEGLSAVSPETHRVADAIDRIRELRKGVTLLRP